MNNEALPLYQIADWNETFENAKSRTVKDTKFVCKPNKLSGVGLMNVQVEPDGAAIYGIWAMLVCLCSLQKPPRQGYLTANGKKDGRRYRMDELAYAFRRPEREIVRCLKVVSSPEVAWLRLVDAGSGERGIPSRDTSGEQSDTTGEQGILSRDTTGEQSDTTGEQGVLSGVTEGMNEGMKEPPSVPQRGTGTNGHRELSHEELKAWVNSLFGRQRAWSYEEEHLLSDLAPVSKEDRALLSWAYTLPRDSEGWAMIAGKRTTKRKENVIGLLRDFASEVDKWRGWKLRRNGSGMSKIEHERLSADWVSVLKKIYGDDVSIPSSKSLLAPSVIAEVEAALPKEAA